MKTCYSKSTQYLNATRFSLSMEMSRLTRDGTAEPVSRDQILRHARGQGNIHFPCSADHEQDWQPYPVDPYSAICEDYTYIHTQSTSRPSSHDKYRVVCIIHLCVHLPSLHLPHLKHNTPARVLLSSRFPITLNEGTKDFLELGLRDVRVF